MRYRAGVRSRSARPAGCLRQSISTFPKGLEKTLSADSLLRFASVDSFAPAQLALRAAFGSLSRPFPKVSILVNPKNPAILSRKNNRD